MMYRIITIRNTTKRLLARGTLIMIAVSMLMPLAVPIAARAAQDDTPPQLTAYTMSPTSFSTESSDQTLTLTVTITDDQAGVCTYADTGCTNPPQVRYMASGSTQFVDFTNFTRTSGTSTNGTYQATATWPKGIKTGNWTVTLFTLADTLGNSVGLNSSQISTIPGATGVTVNNTATHADTTAPTLTAFSVSPTSFSTESSNQTLTATVSITDDQAGVCSASGCGSFYNGSGTQLSFSASSANQFVTFVNFTRTGGTDTNGTYTATAVWKKGMATGNWSVNSFLLVDKLGNSRTMDTTAINTNVPGATGATVANTATHSDTTKPMLTSFSISPVDMNTENSDQVLTATIGVTDDQSGVCTYADDGGNCGDVPQIRIAPLIGTQFRDFTNFTRISGTDTNGVYQATVTIPAHSKEGIWRVQNMTLMDRLGNQWNQLDADVINATVPSATGTTIANTATASSVTIETDWTISNANGSITFPSGTVVTRKGGGSFAFYQMLVQSYDIATRTNTGRSEGVVGTLRTGIPGLDLHFSQPVTVSIYVGDGYNGKKLKIQSLDEDGVRWADETLCTVGGGRCTFTVNHATYFLATTDTSSLLPSILPVTGDDILTSLLAQLSIPVVLPRS